MATISLNLCDFVLRKVDLIENAKKLWDKWIGYFTKTLCLIKCI